MTVVGLAALLVLISIHFWAYATDRDVPGMTISRAARKRTAAALRAHAGGME